MQRVVAVVEDVNQPKSVCLHVWVSCSRLVVPGAVNKGIDKKEFEAKMSSTAKCVESLARIGVIILQIGLESGILERKTSNSNS